LGTKIRCKWKKKGGGRSYTILTKKVCEKKKQGMERKEGLQKKRSRATTITKRNTTARISNQKLQRPKKVSFVGGVSSLRMTEKALASGIMFL